jgi:vancomycin resistance protein YoaR
MHYVRAALFTGFFLLGIQTAAAAPSSLTYTYSHHIITVSVASHPEWRRTERVWLFHGVEAIPPARLKTCGDDEIAEAGWTTEDRIGWNEDAIARTIESDVVSKIDRSAGNVTISKTLSGTILFEGIGLTGRKTDLKLTASLTLKALEDDVSMVVLPVVETQPVVNVEDEELRNMGIREVVTIGESVFAKSPVNRRHNIGVGLKKFNGHLIPQGSVFSFVEILGRVDASTGYRKELVIQGAETLPDYGGGLCQVSSTAYRGPWEYGMPIVQRKNHSYAVSYYSPQGTDATIYPPNVDMKFRNDTLGALLVQTHSDPQDRAYFIYYGTKDDRMTEVYGPYIRDRISAPKEEKISYTTEIPPGEKRKASERHDGMKATWYRAIQMPGSGSTLERFYSVYETRPLYWQIGVTPEEMLTRTPGDLSETPSWLPSKP